MVQNSNRVANLEVLGSISGSATERNYIIIITCFSFNTFVGSATALSKGKVAEHIGFLGIALKLSHSYIGFEFTGR